MSDHQLLSAMRFLGRHKGYTAINILGLSLGLCACIVIYNIVSYELSFDRSYPDRDRIYRVGCRIIEDHGNGAPMEGYGENIPAPAPTALRAGVPGIETLAAYYPYNVTIRIPSSTIPLPPNRTTIIASPDYFAILPYTWLAGDPVQSLARPYGVVLTATRARNYFGDLPADRYLGRDLTYDDSLHVHVTGIMADYPGNTDFAFTDYISFSTIDHSFLKATYRRDQWRFNLGIPGIQAFVKLNRDIDPGKTAAKFDGILQQHIKDDSFLRLLQLTMVLQRLGDVHFNEAYNFDGIRKASRPALYGLTCAAVFVLLLAIVNFINLATAQSMQQVKVIGIRRILGATRLRLITRSLMETAILTALSAILALTLAPPVMALFHDYLPESLPFRPFSLGMICFMAGVIILTTLLAGLYPAINLAGFQSDRTARMQPPQKFTLRRVLIVFQFSISLLFIIAALIVGRQINYMLKADMGFDSSAVVTVTDFGAPPQKLRLFAQQALDIPGVQETTIQGHSPAGAPIIENPMQLDNRSDKTLEVNILGGDGRFVPFYRMRLLAGRNLGAGDSLKEFIINDTYRKYLGFSTPADALSHSITWQGKTLPIVGVVEDFHTNSLHSAITSLVIARVANLDNSVGLRISLANPSTLPRLEALWKNLVPDDPFSYTFLDETIAKLYKKDQQLSWLVGIITAITIFVSCIGLLGLILFIVERKRKEISIRKVLGAGIADIVYLLNKEFVLLVGISLAIASPIALMGMHRWLEGFAYRITISWWMFALAAVIALLISLLTISLRVIRAALVNPTENLRSE